MTGETDGQGVGLAENQLAGYKGHSGSVVLEQMWSLDKNSGFSRKGDNCVALTAARAVFLPPREWTQILLPYKMVIEGKVSVFCALSKKGVLAEVTVTSGGQIKVNAWNMTQETVYLTPKTVIVNLIGAKIGIKRFGSEKVLQINSMSLEDVEFGEMIKEKIMEKFPGVGDLSSHPVNKKMEKLLVRATEVKWNEPPERGSRTQYSVESVADRNLINKQLGEYVQRGYLKEVSVADDIYLSPLLPIKKPNGTFRFTNDFRKLNSYFPSDGTTQVDVWRKMWEIKPEWKYFMKIDLKDGFFGIPVDDELSRLFGFSYGTRRFCWKRLPQGWKWSSVLFCERVAEILRGIECPQYSDDVLVGAEAPEILLQKAESVFKRFEDFGVKVNYDKVVWLTDEITFLGYEIKHGKMTQKKYLEKRMNEIGVVTSIKGLERVIGIISYTRRVIKGSEVILGPLREDLKYAKKHETTGDWWSKVNEHIKVAFGEALDKVQFLSVPGMKAKRYILETDWSSDYSGYLLFAQDNQGKMHLMDIGSKVGMKAASSYLGELDTIVWACKRTKAFRGDVPLLIRTDCHGILDKSHAKEFYDGDMRSFRRWSWMISNEPGFVIEFCPGSENCGADLISRPDKKSVAKGEANELEVFDVNWIEDDVGKVIIKKLDGKAVIPSRKSAEAAGYDLSGIEDVIIPKGERRLIRTGLSMAIPNGIYGRIAPRSGLAVKNGLTVGAGVIDPDYRGEVKVLLFNQGNEEVQLKIGDRIAQFVFEKISLPELMDSEELTSTERGIQGFGSTGGIGGISAIEKEATSESLIWREHLPAHWGADKIFWALRKKGLAIPIKRIKETIAKCEVCARFRKVRPRGFWGQPPFSLEPGHTVFMDFVGPVTTGKGGVKYIFCMIDSCTRMGGAWKFRTTFSKNVIKGVQEWMFRYGSVVKLVSDNAAYFTSEELKRWCASKGIEQVFIAPHRHESVGLVERYQQTLIDRLRKMTFDKGGSWSDHLQEAVQLINISVNKTTGFSPKELWTADVSDRELAYSRSQEFRKKRNEKRRYSPKRFFVGQKVLVYDAVAASAREDKFLPHWKGPYELVKQISPSMWRAKELNVERGVGRRPTLIFHQDHLQPYDFD